MNTWNPNQTCKDCNGPCYHDTVRCAHHGLLHAWKAKGSDLGRRRLTRVQMWSNPVTKRSGTRKLPNLALGRVA